MEIRRYTDPVRYSERLEPWLLESEAEHNVLLGLLPRLRSGDHDFEAPIYLASVEYDGAVVGCAYRTPPFKLGISRLPAEAITPLVDHVARVYAQIPAVLGPERETLAWAAAWSRKTACAWAPGLRQRIHACEQVRVPDAPPGGALRRALPADAPLLLDWMKRFVGETGADAGDLERGAARLLAEEGFFLWEDREPRCMLARSATTPGGARVGYVFTPRSFRGRGYASVAVATLTERLLRAGRRRCFLYTDRSNPTSNRVYARVGYEPVCDVIDADFNYPAATAPA